MSELVPAHLETASAQELLKWVERTLGRRAALAASFGVEDMVLLDLTRQFAPSLEVFTLDTGRLPPETYELMEAARVRYGVRIETFSPRSEDVRRLETEKGYFSFRESIEARRECCGLRKVEPLARALHGRAAWVTGLRREQSPARSQVNVVERDAVHGVLKLNPLAAWSRAQVWAYVRENRVPYNRLHDAGYASIGCAPCTRAVKPFEDERAGRWWWESGHKECGLHVAR